MYDQRLGAAVVCVLRIMLEVNLEGLIFSVVIVKDDFGTVGGIAHQHVAKILVGLNIIGSSVARLGIRLAAKRRGLQGLARRVVNVRDGSLLGIGRVDNRLFSLGWRIGIDHYAVNGRLIRRVAWNRWRFDRGEGL